MSSDLSAQFELLRKLHTRVQSKEDVPPEDYAAAGMKNKARLKDIEKEISSMRKRVSQTIKQEEAKLLELELEENPELRDAVDDEPKEYNERLKLNRIKTVAADRRKKLQTRERMDEELVDEGADDDMMPMDD